jgi:hypothetical protein
MTQLVQVQGLGEYPRWLRVAREPDGAGRKYLYLPSHSVGGLEAAARVYWGRRRVTLEDARLIL